MEHKRIVSATFRVDDRGRDYLDAALKSFDRFIDQEPIKKFNIPNFARLTDFPVELKTILELPISTQMRQEEFSNDNERKKKIKELARKTILLNVVRMKGLLPDRREKQVFYGVLKEDIEDYFRTVYPDFHKTLPDETLDFVKDNIPTNLQLNQDQVVGISYGVIALNSEVNFISYSSLTKAPINYRQIIDLGYSYHDELYQDATDKEARPYSIFVIGVNRRVRFNSNHFMQGILTVAQMMGLSNHGESTIWNDFTKDVRGMTKKIAIK